MRAIPLKENTATPLNDTYSITLGKPLEQYSSTLISAHAVQSKQKQYLGLLSHNHLPPRYLHLEKLAHSNMQIMMRPLAYFPVLLPGEKHYRTLVITDKPRGVPLPLNKNGKAIVYREEAITDLFLKPYLKLLKDLEARGLTYRSLRPGNVYFFQNQLIFGECFMLPPAYLQPASYDPIYSALAEPDARGTGTIADDIFAAGIMVLSMAIGKDFSHLKNPDTVIEERLTQNSLTALLGEYRLSERLTEFLKGTLSDNPGQRWSLSDVDDWAEGQKVPLRHHQPSRKASRPFVFQKKDYLSIPQLTVAIGQQVSDAPKTALDIITSKDMEGWLARSNGQKAIFSHIKDGINNARRAGGGVQRQVQPTFALAGMCSGMPLFYNRQAFASDGIGFALAARMHDNNARKLPFDLILSKVIEFTIELEKKLAGRISNETMTLQKALEQLGILAQKTSYGMGIERCLYELNSRHPCQSQLLEHHLVQTPLELLNALEALAKNESNHKLMPIDRHIAAFTIARTRKVSEATLYNLGDTDKAKAALATVQILGLLEKQYAKGNTYPHLCKWVLKISKPIVTLYKSKARQQMVKAQLEKIKNKSNLNAIADIIDQPIEKHNDDLEFEQAQDIYAKLQKRLEQLEDEQADLNQTAKNIARHYAPFISGGLAGLLAIALVGLR